MKKHIKILSTTIALIGFTSCSVEAPFQGEQLNGDGGFQKSALNLEVSSQSLITSRASENDIKNDFKIEFIPVSEGNGKAVTYNSLKEMPEVVRLEAGTYKIKASYGENQDAGFEKPYYLGNTTEEFTIEPNKIVTDIETIKCKLENVKVTIKYHWTLYERMSDDSYVEVKVNNSSSLQFTKSHADSQIAGYFKHSDVCTLTATFKGKVDGAMIEETKTLSDVVKGNHYEVTFSLNNYGSDNSGNANGQVSVDANVSVKNVDGENAILGEDEILSDNERPKEESPSEEEPGDKPDDPEDKKITVESTVPLGVDNVIYDGIIVKLDIHSPEPIDVFKVTIDSPDLAELIQYGSGPGILDLVNPTEAEKGFLNGLHLLEGDSVGGETDVTFDVSGFMKMLSAVEGRHPFIINVEAGKYKEEITLILVVPEK